MIKQELKDASKIFHYNEELLNESQLEDYSIGRDAGVHWLNIYGFEFESEVQQLFRENQFDDFLNVLVKEDDHRNKLVELDDSFYVTVSVLLFDNDELDKDVIRFILKGNVLISQQKKPGDYFEKIRTNLRENRGIVRKRQADYLLYRLLNAIVDKYRETVEGIESELYEFKEITKLKPTTELVIEIEEHKSHLLEIKQSLKNLKEIAFKMQKVDIENLVNDHYFEALGEEIRFLLDDIDANLQLQDSNLNLIFNIQSNRLNEVMKTLTIFSVIFIPLTFLAGIYGMNFKNIPETQTDNGYFVLLGAMLIITIISVVIFKRKKWF